MSRYITNIKRIKCQILNPGEQMFDLRRAVSSIFTSGNETFNIFIFFTLVSKAKRGFKFYHLTRNASRIQLEMGNEVS